ncbi:GDP-fucose protein O-fucosyltransferase 2, putative [Plasmodium malariae]|uniref:GDP-fucose protein O-fucosyltransferase 2 n=1 Tax=Plasmodium malariae TaxID=5858 RepID=A0A1D3JM46_PLAMA|nr:GDP-fucose protein O-fucosyltransferase 2, putative [Plasmodium malariae]SBT87747.1 GDP-fucose protein O-fucosyltransferase 2, putative [Plasmodium malariae]
MNIVILNLVIFLLSFLEIVAKYLHTNLYSHICKKDDVYSGYPFYFLKKKKYLLYDVNIGEGFNLQKEILYRMALIVYYLNQGDRKNLYYLVLPPWCYLTHWKRKTSDQIKWSSFFNITIIKNVIPVIEFSDYEVLYGNHVDYIICFKYFVGDFVSSEEGNTAVSSSSDPTFNILSFEKCSSGGYKYKQICNNCEYNYSVIYSGKCTTMKGKNTECYGFPFITSYFASSIVDNLFSSYNDSILIKQGNSLLVPFVNELFEKNMEDILLFNEDLINEGNYYIRDILGTNNYISAHLRYNDFRKIVRYDLPPIHVAVGKLLYIMFINNINKIFISSDEKKQIEKVLNKQFNQYKDFFYFYDNTYLHDGHVAIIDQWICINAKIFVGNIFSRFSMHIKWERHLMNKREKGLNIDLCGYNINNDEQLRKNYKQVENLYDQEALHKLNHIFMNYSEKDKKYLNTVCYDYPSHFPSNGSIYRMKYIPYKSL